MSDQMDIVDAEETSLAAVTDDSHTADLIELVPFDRAPPVYCKPEFIEPVFEVKPEDLQLVKQVAYDDYCKPVFIERVVEVKPEDLQDVKQNVKHLASDDYCKPEFIEPVVEVKPEDLLDVKQEPADDSYSEAAHYSVKVSFFYNSAFLILETYSYEIHCIWQTFVKLH